MESNKELRTAWEFIEHTDVSIFLTGKAGTGKTTFLKTVKERSTKRMIVVAPTGVAAINAGGVTIHSFFQLPPSPYVPGTTVRDRFNFSKVKRNIIRTLDMLVIDEISMVRADLLDEVDSVLRRYRDATAPFGGVQLVMIGDLQQLTPVVTPQDEAMLKPYYDTPYFFGSKALQQVNYVTIQLQHVYRQQDDAFIAILNHVREGHITPQDAQHLNARCKPAFLPKAEEGYIRLTTHNRLADSYNETELHNLPGQSLTFKATVDGNFPEYSYPTDLELKLKIGAQVMFVKNDTSPSHEYYNGLIGHICAWNKDSIDVKCPGRANPIKVEQQTWENNAYELDPETKEIKTTVQGTFTQYPLRLAWAITIHKSQGLTFEHAIIDAEMAFASGQVYVALSRCKSLDGLVLTSPISDRLIIRDSRVSDYISHQQEAAEKSIEALPDLKEEYFRNLLLDLFNFNELVSAEQMVYRHLLEFFHDFNTLAMMHGKAIEALDQKVSKVAYTWQTKMRRMTHPQLHEAVFLDRVKRSCTYFHDTLQDILSKLNELTKMAQTGNKAAMDRMDDLYKNMLLSYVYKVRLLRQMSDQPFDVPTYLHIKQETLLDAMELVSPGSMSKHKLKRKRKDASRDNPYADKAQEPAQSPKSQGDKVKKESSAELSLQMFKQGKSIEEIAKARGLKPITISGHLCIFVERGELDVHQFVSQQKIDLIHEAIKKAGEEAKWSDIKSLLPQEVSYEDITFVIRGMDGGKKG